MNARALLERYEPRSGSARTLGAHEVAHAIASYTTAHLDFDRRDRLTPSSPEVFDTNPLSLGYGAGGVALLLRHVYGRADPRVLAWIKGHRLSADNYPPGLLMGLAGIAYCLVECGDTDAGAEALELAYTSPLAHADPTMFNGAAGWGLVSLYLHEKTGDERYLDRALSAATSIRSLARQGPSWVSALDGKTHLGYGYGASGIALFLLAAGSKCSDQASVTMAANALEFDLRHEDNDGFGPSWPAHPGDQVLVPYWAHGAAGIGTVALRFYQSLGGNHYLGLARRIADESFCKWAINPTLLSGLTGIGEFQLDMYRATGEPAYLDRAYDIADTLLLYRIPTPHGLAFPDRWLARISTDYAAGSAGVGLFFDRLATLRDRPVVDLVSWPCREPIEQHQ